MLFVIVFKWNLGNAMYGKVTSSTTDEILNDNVMSFLILF